MNLITGMGVGGVKIEDLQKQVDELKVLINRIEQVTHDGLTRYEIKQFKEAKGWIRE